MTARQLTPEREAELLPWIRLIEESFPNDDQTRALQDLRDGLAFERERADRAETELDALRADEGRCPFRRFPYEDTLKAPSRCTLPNGHDGPHEASS